MIAGETCDDSSRRNLRKGELRERSAAVYPKTLN